MASTTRTPINAVVASKVEITPGWQCVVSTPVTVGIDNPTDSVVDLEKQVNVHELAQLSTLPYDNVHTSQAELLRIQQATPLPPKAATSAYRSLRWNFFSVYRKLFTLVLTLNLIAVVVFLGQLRSNGSIATYQNAATAASANFCAAILLRNEHVVNALFHIVLSIPVWAPLSIRRRAAKIYSYGGAHSSCGFAGTIWYVIFAVLTVTQYPRDTLIETALAVTTGITLMLLLIIIIFAHPMMRARLHNHFEVTHRYGGWSVIIVLWVQTMLLVISNSMTSGVNFGVALVLSPPFWFLAVITVLIVYPWTRMRMREVDVEHLSNHATRLHFKYTNLKACMAVRLTDAPLSETHAFATIPNYKEDGQGFSIIISNAGDWTKKIINNPPKRIWIKGVPTIGVMRVALMFKKVLVIATGSGIGPGLSLLQSNPDYPTRVLWSAPSPEKTFGQGIIRSIFRTDPDAVIIDTKKTGRPDILAIAYAMFVQSDCEAVIVISNPVVTRKVVYGFEARGVPAYGPVFDS